MPLRLYMDHHVSRAMTSGLRRRGVDVLTAAEDGATRLPDPVLLDRASELGRVLFSQDRDLLEEATLRQREGRAFAGLIYAHQLFVPVGVCVEELELHAKVSEPSDLRDQVIYLPL